MDVYFLNEKKQYDNTERSVQQLFQEIHDFIANQEENVFSHLVIDGTEVYDDYDQYVMAHLPQIQEIKVIVKTKQEMALDLEQSLHDYLDKAIPSMKQLANALYQGQSEEVWNEFILFIDGLRWIVESLGLLIRYMSLEANQRYEEAGAKLGAAIPEMLDAVEAGDTLALADMIQYEIVETLVSLQQNRYH